MREYINIVESFTLEKLDPAAAERMDKIYHALLAAYTADKKRNPEEYGDADPEQYAHFFVTALCGHGAQNLSIDTPERIALRSLKIAPNVRDILTWVEGPKLTDTAASIGPLA